MAQDVKFVANGSVEPGPVPVAAPKVNLQYNPFELRALRSKFLTIGTWLIAFLGAIPLFSVIYMLVVKGGARLGTDLFSELPPAGFELGGGIGNAIQGTLVTVAIAALISIPIALAAAIYLAELRPHGRIAAWTRFLSKVLTGFPSILAGVFVYAAVVLLMGTYSAIAGGIALAVLMLPTVTLTAEGAMGMVPQKMKDAAIGMGCTKAQVVWSVTLPTALPSVVTGIILCGGAGGWRIRAASLHRAVQQLLAAKPARADSVTVHSDLQLLEHAVRKPDRARMGGVARSRHDRFGLQHLKPLYRSSAGLRS